MIVNNFCKKILPLSQILRKWGFIDTNTTVQQEKR